MKVGGGGEVSCKLQSVLKSSTVSSIPGGPGGMLPLENLRFECFKIESESIVSGKHVLE